MLSCHLCLLISCYSVVFCFFSFDCSFCLTAWYLHIFYFLNESMIDNWNLDLHKEISGRFQQGFKFDKTAFVVHSGCSKFQVSWNLLKLKAIVETSILCGNLSFIWLKPDWNLKGVSAVRKPTGDLMMWLLFYFSHRLGCNLHEYVHFVYRKSSFPVFHEHIDINSWLIRRQIREWF